MVGLALGVGVAVALGSGVAVNIGVGVVAGVGIALALGVVVALEVALALGVVVALGVGGALGVVVGVSVAVEVVTMRPESDTPAGSDALDAQVGRARARPAPLASIQGRASGAFWEETMWVKTTESLMNTDYVGSMSVSGSGPRWHVYAETPTGAEDPWYGSLIQCRNKADARAALDAVALALREGRAGIDIETGEVW